MGEIPAFSPEIHEDEPREVVEIGKIVTVKLGDSEKTFLVVLEDGVLPDGISKDMLPDGVIISSVEAPIVKTLLGKVEGDIIEPNNDELASKKGQLYRKSEMIVMKIASLDKD